MKSNIDCPEEGPGSSPAGSSTPLGRPLVLDFSHYVSAATCAMTLADLGADVVKIESPGRGDDLRHLGPMIGDGSASFAWSNRNKRAVALDLKSSEGQQVALDLADRADVLIENYSTGVMARFGLSSARLLERNPRLVYCSVSAYAREGPLANRPGFDPVVQAESGLMSLTGLPDSDGLRTGTAVTDLTTGFLATIAVLSALIARERTGLGQHVEVSLFDSAIALAGIPIMSYLASGQLPVRAGNASREAAPTDVYRASDGALYIACPSDSLFVRLATDVLGRPNLALDPRFATNAGRMSHTAELRQELESVLCLRSRHEWMERMRNARIPAGAINNIGEVIASQEMRERGLLSWVPHAVLGKVPSLALPFLFSKTPVAVPQPAPALGEHTGAVLADVLGYSVEQVEALRAAGAFGAPNLSTGLSSQLL